jgi:hypothetical protein
MKKLFEVEIKQEKDHFGIITPYFDYDDDKFCFMTGYQRRVAFRSSTTGRVIIGLVYPYYPVIHDKPVKLHVRGIFTNTNLTKDSYHHWI